MKRLISIMLLIVLSIILSSCDLIGEGINSAPSIEGNNSLTYNINSEAPDWTEMIIATDKEDGAIRISESMVDSNVDFTVAGNYEVKFFVPDSDDKTTLFLIDVQIVDDREITFSLQGDNEITLEVNTEYVDPDVIALDLDGNEIIYSVDGTVNANVVGVYQLSYNIPGVDDPLVRTINVVDTTAPIITLDTVNLLYGVYDDLSWLDYIDNVNDNYSQNIIIEVTDNTINYDEAGTYFITIKATDEAGNESTATFSVMLLEIALLINGDSVIEHEVHTDYSDTGATALDASFNPFEVTSISDLNIDVLGTYSITYTVTGFESISISRTIHVVDTIGPVIEVSDQTILKSATDIDWTTRYDSITDNYDTNITITEVEDNILYGTAGDYTVILMAEDSTGNQTSATINITISETMINILSELPDEEITIDFWHIYGQSKAALLDDMIDEFELLYPNITVRSESQGYYTNLLSTTINAIETGVTPDIVVGYPDHIATYLDMGGLIPLDDFIDSDTWGVDLNDFIDSYVAENQQFTNEMYSMPFSKTTEIIVYNKDKFEANNITFDPNEIITWEDLEVIGDTMVGDGNNQCEFLSTYDSAPNLFINSSLQWDADYTNSDGEILIDNDTTKAMMNYYKGLFDENILALPIEWDESYGSNNFLAQDVCMLVGITASIYYNNPFTQLDLADRFEIGVLPAPQFEGKTQSAFQLGPNISILENTSDAERLASWLLIKYLTSAENTAKWAIRTEYLPVRKSGYTSDIYNNFLTNPSPEYTVESLVANAAYASIGFNNYDTAFSGIGQISSTIVRQQAGYFIEAVYLGTKTIDEAIADMLAQLTQ
jgi:multiple sugar transport system substrate-binding protein